MDGQSQPNPWLENLLFVNIFRTFRMAIQPSKMIIAFGALVAIFLAGAILDLSRSVTVTPGTNGQETELQIYMSNPQRLDSYIERLEQDGERRGVFSVTWDFARTKFHAALAALFAFNLPLLAEHIAQYVRAICWACSYHPWYCIVLAAIKLVVIAVAGGAICRISALQFAREEKPGVAEGLRFSTRRFVSLLTTPLLPFAIIALVGICVVVLGLIGSIPAVGEIIVAIGTPLALVAGALVALILIGTVAGFNLMYPAIAFDGSDCFDAISRSFNYIYARPWRMGYYTGIAAVYGAICYVFVRFFVFLMIWSTRWLLGIGMFFRESKSGAVSKITALWPEPSYMNLYPTPGAALGTAEQTGAWLVHIWLLVVIGLVVSFVISFYFSANTVIYSLLRNRVDKTALDDIYIDVEPVKTETEAMVSQDATKGGEEPDEGEGRTPSEEEAEEPEGSEQDEK